MSINVSDRNAKRLENIKQTVIEMWHEYDDTKKKIVGPKPRGWAIKYPPHDETHSEKIGNILDKLLPDEKVVDKAFSDDERFLLLAAVWLHDVGMNPELFGEDDPYCKNDGMKKEVDMELRKKHNERSAKWIRSNCAKLRLNEQECERLSTIALLHRRAEKIPDDLDIKIRLIIAYFRLADALHIPDRAPLGKLKTHLAYGMDPTSKFHWFKSFYVLDSEPSEKEFKITVGFKKPISWNGNPEEDMTPLVDVLIAELKDEMDSVKSILLEGKLRFGLPAYIDMDSTFERTYMEDEHISDLYSLLAIIDLFNPIITPNSGAVVDIVLNQIKRYADITDPNGSIRRLEEYQKNTLQPLLTERPCHVYIRKVCDKLEEWLNNLKNELAVVHPPETPEHLKAIKIYKIQKKIKELQDERKALEKVLPPKVFGVTDTLYLFNWDSVPGDDNKKLQNFLKDDLDIDWAENAEITKDGMTISITKGANSAKIIMDVDEKKAILEIREDKKYLRVIEQNGKRNIYKNFLTSEDRVLVYGYSSSVIMTLNALPVDVKKEITVYVCECSTKTKHRYNNKLIYCDGLKYFLELKKVGIRNVKYIVDLCASNLFSIGEPTDAGRKFKRITKVLFGANGIDKTTGEVAHGLGHLAIADMAASHHIPVFVITESKRIGDLVENPGHMREGPWYPTDIWFDVIDESNSYNPREERVPCKDLITNIITEKGVYPDKSLEAISSNIDDI